MSAPSSATPPHPPKPYRDTIIIHAGKAYGMMYSIWEKFRDIVERGPALTEINPSLLSGLNRAYREEWLNLLSIEPKLADIVTKCALTSVTSQLEKGRHEFRNSQVHFIHDQIPRWGIGVPDNARLRGFGNDVCGRLLCPSTMDWDDPTDREQLQSYARPVGPSDFPRFLWDGGRVDPQDMNKGFLRGELLLKVLLSILIGPAAARPGGESTGVGGYADIWNLQTMTVPSLAFAATVAHYALSADSTCHWLLKPNSVAFNHTTFYQRIVEAIKSWKEEDQRSLLLWWNGAILSHVPRARNATSFADAPAPGSAAALMMEQAANTRTGLS